MQPRTAIAKGKALENYVADQIRSKGIDPKARRSIGSGSGTREKADIDTTMMILGVNVGIECKNYAVAKVREWWAQAEKLEFVRRVPVVTYKLKGESYEDTKVILRLDTFLDMAKRAEEPKIMADDNFQQKRDLQYLKNAIKVVEKYLK